MSFEVEQKFRVDDSAAIAAELELRGLQLSQPESHVDRYFNHPSRDFAQTDEAFRIRQIGDQSYLTYKGPKLDRTTKTRREIEIPILSGNALEDFAEMLLILGFRPVASVHKRRRKTSLEYAGHRIEIVLDDVEHVGTYVELECIASETQTDAAKSAIALLAAELGLSENERKSYLELLLERR